MTFRVRLSLVLITVAAAVSLGLTGAAASGAPAAAAPQLSAVTAGAGQHRAPNPPARIETVYVPITPCRILDTRQAGGKMANGAVRTFYVGGTGHFLPQGGRNGGCGIPVGATAVAASIGATRSAADGFLTAWPANLPRPNASNVNYTKGQTIANGSTLTISKSAAALKIANYGGPTDLFVDVTGYYAQQMHGFITLGGTVSAGSDRVLSAQTIGTGSYQVKFDTDVQNCTSTVTTNGANSYGSATGFSGPYVYVSIWTLNPVTHGEVASAHSFYITVTC